MFRPCDVPPLQTINIYESDYEVLILSMCNSQTHSIRFLIIRHVVKCVKYKLTHAHILMQMQHFECFRYYLRCDVRFLRGFSSQNGKKCLSEVASCTANKKRDTDNGIIWAQLNGIIIINVNDARVFFDDDDDAYPFDFITHNFIRFCDFGRKVLRSKSNKQ